MKFFIHITLMLLICARFAGAGKDRSNDSSLIKYLAGLYLLDNATELTVQQKVQRYSQLVHLTGISADSALRYISWYKDKPEAWKKISGNILTLFSTYENKCKNDTISSMINVDSTKINKKRSK